MEDNERWLPVEKFKRLHVSDKGRVKTIWPHKEKILQPMKAPTSKGHYLKVSVSPNEGGNQKQVMIHTLVAEAFVERPSTDVDLEVNHKDGDKTNNCSSNLEWTTHAGNIKHAFDTGLKNSCKGGNHGHAVPVRAINTSTGETIVADTINELVSKLGVQRSFVSRRINNPDMNNRKSRLPYRIEKVEDVNAT